VVSSNRVIVDGSKASLIIITVRPSPRIPYLFKDGITIVPFPNDWSKQEASLQSPQDLKCILVNISGKGRVITLNLIKGG